MAVVKKYFLSTLWTQDGKVTNCGSNENMENGINFNQYAPLDLSGDQTVRSYTGCASTAVSQVIYYHLMNDHLNDDISYNITPAVLNERDAYVSFATIPALTLYISDDFRISIRQCKVQADTVGRFFRRAGEEFTLLPCKGQMQRKTFCRVGIP